MIEKSTAFHLRLTVAARDFLIEIKKRRAAAKSALAHRSAVVRLNDPTMKWWPPRRGPKSKIPRQEAEPQVYPGILGNSHGFDPAAI
jgi:hypothetical protein